ncbi:copper amine oxidase N-terminal domain-containing protein [Paenibacillus paeoniae]|uniref:Copper amine oxidase N-terminal domain-containing protein n=1 Tax=Paenibacillus paeoniae TaxID=2292705 RepID=A0A371PN75_9BACL|nr:copper amine oxidase N-terminal domain-containing protein [Paenibacillus paeoniae]REK77652.1 copper amine oxidase N-terminal domain-containing protein [Paenibacillus paeoniae]
MKKYVKNTICALTAVACLTGGASAFANQEPQIVPISAPIVPISTPAYEIMQQKWMDSISVYGTVTFLEDGRIMLENNNENAKFDKIILNVSEDTLILDAVSGLPKSVKDIRENEIIYAYVGPAMTMSLPPMTNAELLLTSIPADFAVPTYEEIDSVKHEENGSVTVHTNRDGKYIVTDDTVLFPYLTKNIVTKHDLVPGAKLLVWKQSVKAEGAEEAAESVKMMVFPYSYNGFVQAGLEDVAVNGEALELADGEQPYVANGRLMLPFRQVVEALGYTIEWKAETNSIKVLKGDQEQYAFTARGKEVTKGEEPYELLEAAALKNGVTFMAADDLLLLSGAKLVE